MELPDVARVERLSLRPGDRLVLTCDHQLDDREWHVLSERMGAWAREVGLPKGGILILDAGMSLQMLEAAT